MLAFATLAGLAATSAHAIGDAEELIRFGGSGSGAGELSSPWGLATDPVTGHLYVAEQSGSRISEFTPWGEFVKAFGWDVAPGAVNEQQEVRVKAARGQFKLSFGASTTADLAFDAPGSEDEGPESVEAALNALPSIGGAGGQVSVKAVPAPPGGETPTVYVVAFEGSLASTDVGELTIASGTTPLNGGDPSTTFEVRTRADGTPGGTGLESCTEESGCKAGVAGAGVGQLSNAQGIAVDSAGNVYVREVGNHRVQKFDSAGRFELMFGGEVDKTTSANRCTKTDLEGGDVCGIGTTGTGNGQFGDSLSPGIALGAGGKLFAGDVERIQRFDLEGEWEASVPVVGKTVHDLAIAPGNGDFYATVGQPTGTDEDVRILDPTTGAEKGKLQADELKDSHGVGASSTVATGGPVATDPAGDVFARRNNVFVGIGAGPPVLSFDSAGQQTAEFGLVLPRHETEFKIDGFGTNSLGGLYVSSGLDSTVTALGPGPVAFEAPPPVAPTISAQFATSVERTGAVLGAEINPHFWSDARYYVQYGTGKCSEGGCTAEKPVPPGVLLGANPVDAVLKSTGIFIEGLTPGTTYHYRFVAQSSGGGPVRGIGGVVGTDGEESTFTTYPAQSPFKTDCQNQQFRTGFSAPLPDCRAYEMVSPIDKNNGDIKALVTSSGYSTALTQSSSNGERFTYTSSRAFANPQAAPYAHQYLAERSEGTGWQSESLMPSEGPASVYPTGYLDSQYKAFSDDLCNGWLVAKVEPPLVTGPQSGAESLLRHDNCGGQGFASLEDVAPPIGREQFIPELQGISADGEAAIFGANDQLTPEAPSGRWQAYYASDGQLRLICILPSGSPIPGNCSGGTEGSTQPGETVAPRGDDLGRVGSVTNALSADGSKVYWTASSGETGPGKVYLRLNPAEEQSAVSDGECTEPEKACTVRVSETASTKASRFLGASPDGGKALFEVTEGLQKGALYLFDQETGESTLIAGKTLGVAGASEDLSHVYFVSEEALGGGAQAERPNLYLSEEGAINFVATLSDADTDPIATAVAVARPTDTAPQPVFHAARVSPNGSHIAFISTERLSGYDNTDQVSGAADSEVYLYQAGSGGPVCVSCNPSGARPIGRSIRLNFGFGGFWSAAALIPPAQLTLHFQRSLSGDGSRVFFDSYDALLPRDTNGRADVYEWEAASGAGDCEEKGAEVYVPSSQGCLSLISSGQSPADSEFLDADASGSNVFFTTQTSLLPQDPGLVDVYDARAGGGLPAPPEPPGPCQGEACQIAPPPPNDPTPASASFKGAGNFTPAPRCRKGRVARKGRCVAKKRKQASRHHGKRRTNRNRGANR